MNGGRSVATRIDRLCAIDHDILGLLQVHRVLTTPQLITLTQRPERTIDYRLARLRERSLVDRTRPYAASGSAPFYWWLTRAGARLVEGTSPAPGKGTPNPLFLRHAAAIAGLHVALCDAGPSVGLTLSEWRRDEDAWEDWSGHRGAGRIRPDAYAEVHLDVDGHDGVAGAFVEVDFATMDQARLRAKVARHRSYCTDTIWWDRHPCCPALLLVTTSEARVNRFLAGVEKDRPRPSPYPSEDPTHYEELVAACAAVTSPEDAVVAPVWRASVGDAPMSLSALLAPDVRQYRQVVARVEAAQRQHDEYQRRQLVHDLHRNARAVADALGDEEAAAAVIRYLFAGPLNVLNPREQWGLDHLDLVEQTASWWAQAKADAGLPAPSSVLDAWRALYRECWTAQADVLLSGNEAARRADPRLCQPAAALAAGGLADDRELQPGSPIDGRDVLDEAMAEHERRRSAAVTRALKDLPLHRRLRTERADLEAAYDAEHLLVCPSCAVPCNDDEPPGRSYHVQACRCCGGALVRLVDAPELPPPLEQSLERIAARRTRLWGRQ
ncbi:MAG: replication-relaxation family protein [Actinomycetota bacterium]|nr:replication-relaxation family protein [Actinomycetota bacterium]